jgi:hypothetical protein
VLCVYVSMCVCVCACVFVPTSRSYSSDDINKFLWPVRIGSGVYPNDMPGERDFLSSSVRRMENIHRGTLDTKHRHVHPEIVLHPVPP